MINLNILKRLFITYRTTITSLSILILYFALSSLNIFSIPYLKTNDLILNFKYNISKKPKNLDKLSIVTISDIDYKVFGEKWPWDRNIFASFVYKINKYKPAVIGFSLGFIGENPGIKESDIILAESFRDAGNVILASYFDVNGRYVMPLEEFRKYSAGCGFTNKPLDKDNVVRKTKLFEKDNIKGNIIDYSFDFKLFCFFENYKFENISEFLEKYIQNNALPINFSARHSDFATITFSDILNDKVQPDIIKDRIVLIGTSAEIFHDTYLTPLGRMPSVFITANTILMLINKVFIYQVPAFINYFILILLTLFMSILISKIGIFRGGIFVICILMFSAGLAIFLALYDILWNISDIILVLPTAYIVNLLVDYISLFLQSSHIKKMVLTDSLTGLSTRRYLLFKIEAELKRGTDFSLVLFNIDNFEAILNATDLEKANLLIKKIGELLTNASRKTRGIDFISRYAETKFCVLLHNTKPKGAISYSERISTYIEKEIIVPVKVRSFGSTRASTVSEATPLCAEVVSPGMPGALAAVKLSISVGIANIKNIPCRYSRILLKCAEHALLRASGETIRKICVFDPKLDNIPPAEYIMRKEISEADLSYVVEELEEKNKELAILLNKLHTLEKDVIASERLSSVGKLAATIYHDLNKPIANIQGGLKVIKEELDKLDQKELSDIKTFIDLSTEETKRLAKLCRVLRDMYRPIEKELKEVQINPIIDELLNLSFAQILERKIKLIKIMPPDLPNIIADTGDLKQVFLNLIINAIESMPNGGELEIKSGIQEGMLEVAIRDTGCGIPPENKDKLFNAFFSTKTEKQGSGLGLYSSLEIIKNYGGTIKADSVVNKGSIFTVYIPYKKS